MDVNELRSRGSHSLIQATIAMPRLMLISRAPRRRQTGGQLGCAQVSNGRGNTTIDGTTGVGEMGDHSD